MSTTGRNSGSDDARLDVEVQAKSPVALPSNLAFVVQFRAGPTQLNGLPAGRVEHVATGDRRDVEDVTALLDFLREVLAAQGSSDPA